MSENMKDYLDEIDKSMQRLSKNDLLEGEIINITKEELIVNINYIADGLVKKEEAMLDQGLSLETEFKVGDKLNLMVLNPSDSEGNVLLSLTRAVKIKASEEIEEAFKSKEAIKVKVVQILEKGVIGDYKGIRGFIPGSLLAARYVEDFNIYKDKEIKVQVEELTDKKLIFSRKELEMKELDKLKEEALYTLKFNVVSAEAVVMLNVKVVVRPPNPKTISGLLPNKGRLSSPLERLKLASVSSGK